MFQLRFFNKSKDLTVAHLNRDSLSADESSGRRVKPRDWQLKA